MKYGFTQTFSVLFFLLAINTARSQSYCTPTYNNGCQYSDLIQSFSTTGGTTNITNNNTGCAVLTGYSNYTTMIHTGIPGGIVNFSFTNGAISQSVYKIWVDWNNNGVLNDAGEEVYVNTSSIGGNVTVTGSFTIPLTATDGPKRLRIRCSWSGTAASVDPCNNQSYGETEDYTIHVNASCTGVPNSGTAQASPTTVVCGESVSLSLTGNTAGSGIAYQWQRNSGAGWANFGTNSPSVSATVTQTTQFRCQVTCTNAGGGTATTGAILVSVTPITVNLGNDTTICPGITQALDATSVAGSAYLWNTSATTPTINVTNPGEYHVRVTQPNGCVGRDTINIGQGFQPTNFLQPSYNLCADSTITLDAGNDSACTFLWSPNSAITQSITVNNAGSYSVLIKSVDNCELVSATSVIFRPRPVVLLPAISTICSVDSLLLDATTPLGHTYNWSTGATTPSIWAKDSTIYSVIVTSQYGCPSWDDTKVEFFPNPTTEGFTFIPYFYEQLGKVTFAPINPQAVNSYRWYFGDGDSSYQKNPTHVYDGSGIYLVTLVVVNHCTETSYSQNVHINLPTGIATTDKDFDVQIYPNPATDMINIKNTTLHKLKAVQVYNEAGRIVYQSILEGNEHSVNLNGLASGIYHIRIQSENNNWLVKKITIVK